MDNGRNNFSITSLEPEGNSETNGNIQIFFYINSNCGVSKTIPASKQAYSLAL